MTPEDFARLGASFMASDAALELIEKCLGTKKIAKNAATLKCAKKVLTNVKKCVDSGRAAHDAYLFEKTDAFIAQLPLEDQDVLKNPRILKRLHAAQVRWMDEAEERAAKIIAPCMENLLPSGTGLNGFRIGRRRRR